MNYWLIFFFIFLQLKAIVSSPAHDRHDAMEKNRMHPKFKPLVVIFSKNTNDKKRNSLKNQISSRRLYYIQSMICPSDDKICSLK